MRAIKTGTVLMAAAALLAAGCASKPATPASAAAPDAGAPVASGGAVRIVKSRDGRFDGEMVGTPAPGSKFAKLQIGMELNEVMGLIGGSTSMSSNETGKRWIPFYYGNDVRRLQFGYANEGCLTFTGGNHWGGGGNELVRITVDPRGICAE